MTDDAQDQCNKESKTFKKTLLVAQGQSEGSQNLGYIGAHFTPRIYEQFQNVWTTFAQENSSLILIQCWKMILLMELEI